MYQVKLIEKLNFLLINLVWLDELTNFNNTSIDRFLRNVTAGLSDSPVLIKIFYFYVFF